MSRSRSRAVAVVTLVAATLACGREAPTAPDCPRPKHPTVRLTPPRGEIPCPRAEDLARIDIPISFEGDPSSGTLACRAADGSWDLTVVQKNVYRTLLFMQTAQFDAPLPWTKQSLWEWFRSSVAGIRIRVGIPVNFCCEPNRVINLIAGGVEESTIPDYLEMMVHEGRHASGGFPHTCNGFDRTIADMGGFGVQYSMVQWLAEHWPAATAEEKEYARYRMAVIRATFCAECD